MSDENVIAADAVELSADVSNTVPTEAEVIEPHATNSPIADREAKEQEEVAVEQEEVKEHEEEAPKQDDHPPAVEDAAGKNQDVPATAEAIEAPKGKSDGEHAGGSERRDRDKDKERKKKRSRSRSRERRKEHRKTSYSRSRSREKDPNRKKSVRPSRSPSPRDQKLRDKDRHRHHSPPVRDVMDRDDKGRRRSSRSRSREIHRRRSPSKDRGRYSRRGSRYSPSRSRSRSRSRDRHGRRGRYRSVSPGGYIPRAPHNSLGNAALAPAPLVANDPASAARALAAAAANPASLLAMTNPALYNVIQPAAAASYPLDTGAMQKLIKEQQMRSQQILLQQQLAAVTAANNAKVLKEQRAARRVYVGNLVPGMVTEDHLKAIFNSALQAAFPGSSLPGMEPVVSITKPTDGRFYFLEMRTPEMATAAMQLGGQVTLHGRVMNVQRPQDYVAPAM